MYPFFSGFEFFVVFIPGEDTLLNLSYTTFDHSSGGNINYHTLLQGFNHHWYIEPDELERNILDRGMTDSVIDSLEKYQKRRFFKLVHYMSAHEPYNRNDYNSFFAEKKSFDRFFLSGGSLITPNLFRKMFAYDMLSEGSISDLKTIYDGQILYVDQQIKLIIDHLKKTNLLDETVIIITADHGEEFGDHNNFGHGHSLYNEMIKIPLIIVGKGVAVEKRFNPVSLIDIFPTILAIAGIHTPDYLPMQGINLISREKTDGKERKVFAMGTQAGDEKYCLIWNNKKIFLYVP